MLYHYTCYKYYYIITHVTNALVEILKDNLLDKQKQGRNRTFSKGGTIEVRMAEAAGMG